MIDVHTFYFGNIVMKRYDYNYLKLDLKPNLFSWCIVKVDILSAYDSLIDLIVKVNLAANEYNIKLEFVNNKINASYNNPVTGRA